MVQPSAKKAVMAAARENRSLSSCMAASCMTTFKMLDISLFFVRRCGVARVCPDPQLNRQRSHGIMGGSNRLGAHELHEPARDTAGSANP